MPSWGIGFVAIKLRAMLGLALLSGALLAAMYTGPALGQHYPAEAVAPTAQEIQDWGFTVEEFQGLVQRTVDLLRKRSSSFSNSRSRTSG